MAKCFYCDDEAHGSCMWSVEKFAPIKASDLSIGDRISSTTLNEVNDAFIIRVRHLQHDSPTHMVVHILMRPINSARYSEMRPAIDAHPDSEVLVWRPAPCERPACEKHIQIRGPKVYICEEHWMAWEKVA